MHRILVLVGAHRHDADDRGDETEGARDQRKEHHAEHAGREVDAGPGGAHGEPAAEDHRADVLRGRRLEQVRAAARAVAHVVADEIRDDGGVARVVLRNPRFHLADEVRTHVGRLGVDTAAELGEERHEARPEAVADDQERDLLVGDSERAHEGEQAADAEQAHGDDEQPGDGAAAQCDLQCAVEARAHRRRRPEVSPDGHEHADVACDARAERAEHEGERGRDRHVEGRGGVVRVVRPDGGVEHEDEHGDAGADHRDSPVLPAEERPSLMAAAMSCICGVPVSAAST